MCAGGYATNTPMMLALQPHTMKMKINVPIGSKADGSGIKAMMWAGAELDPTHASMMFNRASCLPTETAGYKTNGKWYWFGEQPFLKVNLNGDRFCNESGPYEFMLHSMYMHPLHIPQQKGLHLHQSMLVLLLQCRLSQQCFRCLLFDHHQNGLHPLPD